jgi:AcrR family transcriptional regulator
MLYSLRSTAYATWVPTPLEQDSPERPPAELAPIWTRPEPAGRRPRFSRQQIAATALAIADTEGLPAVSMRRVAAGLGAGTMSLYRYVAAKSDLIALLEDALMGETLVPAADLPADWRAALTLIAHRTRQAYLRHPWAIAALQGEAAAGHGVPTSPNGLRRFEQSLTVLAGAPFDTRGKLNLLAIVDDYVMGNVLHAAELSLRARQQPDPALAAGIARFVESQLSSGRFPQLQALSQDPGSGAVTGDDGPEARFELGLQALIDAAFRAWAYPAGRI